MRVGIGYDLHPLEEGRPLVLGGISIPYPKGLAGHSDAVMPCWVPWAKGTSGSVSPIRTSGIVVFRASSSWGRSPSSLSSADIGLIR